MGWSETTRRHLDFDRTSHTLQPQKKVRIYYFVFHLILENEDDLL